MNPTVNLQIRGVVAVACLLGLVLGLVGCKSGPEPQPQIEANRLELAGKLRSYFNKAGGDYSNLSASDKADFDKVAKTANPSRTPEFVFNAMKTAVHGAAQGGTAGGASTTGQ